MIRAESALAQLALNGVDLARFVPRVYDKALGGWVDLVDDMTFALSQVDPQPHTELIPVHHYLRN